MTGIQVSKWNERRITVSVLLYSGEPSWELLDVPTVTMHMEILVRHLI